MTHKKMITAVLMLVLLLALCGCGKSELYTSDRLEVELSGEETKTLTVKFFGPIGEGFDRQISGPGEEANVFSIASEKEKDDTLTFKLKGVSEGTDSLVAIFTVNGEEYALANITVSVDEDLKMTVDNVFIRGEAQYVSIAEDAPESGEISNSGDSSKMIRLVNADTPWYIESFDENVVDVEAYGFDQENGTYDFLVSAVSSGSGTVSIINNNPGQRMTMHFSVVSVLDGENERLQLNLDDSALGSYSRTESEEYASEIDELRIELARFSSEARVPASAEVKDYEKDDDGLYLSLDFSDNELEYIILKGIKSEDEIAEIKKGAPDAETDSFESSGINVQIFQLEDCAIALWEENSLLYELVIIEETNIIKAGDIVEAILGDEAL